MDGMPETAPIPVDSRSVPAEGANAGYFPRDSITRRICRERVLILGLQRFLLLNFAHPLIAAADWEHADLDQEAHLRVERWGRNVGAVIFGTRAEADRAAGHVLDRHQTIAGELREPAGSFTTGTKYSALDPELVLWVHTGLVDSALVAYTTFVGPLPEEAQRRFYAEMKTFGELYGVPRSRQPQDLDELRAYRDHELRSDRIVVTGAARSLAGRVLELRIVRPPLRRALAPVVRSVTTGLLPPQLREQYGLPWGRVEKAVCACATTAVRRGMVPLLPEGRRWVHT